MDESLIGGTIHKETRGFLYEFAPCLLFGCHLWIPEKRSPRASFFVFLEQIRKPGIGHCLVSQRDSASRNRFVVVPVLLHFQKPLHISLLAEVSSKLQIRHSGWQ
jgi:hypothetical protein